MTYEERLQARFKALWPHLDEKTRRLWAASETVSRGRGGLQAVHRVTGLSRSVITEGVREISGKETIVEGRIRRSGGGRKEIRVTDPSVLSDLKELVESGTMGDPESPLLWTTRSLRNLEEGLKAKGHKISHVTVGKLLEEQGFSLQGNRKTLEGSSHVDRDAQFRFISDKAKESLGAGEPVISVDTKKKELVGPFKNGGRAYRRKGDPEKVNVHDFADKTLGKVAPYGVYDVARNEGWVNVGTDHDTSAFAVESIRRWWNLMGKERYPEARSLMITADGGGSNGTRVRLWKIELQKFADETGLEINVSHFPPGTSKWNKIEHRLFSVISMNWRGRPLVSHETIINLIEAAKTRTGLTIRAGLDTNVYPTGIKVTDEEMLALNLHPDRFHGEWNYALKPRAARPQTKPDETNAKHD